MLIKGFSITEIVTVVVSNWRQTSLSGETNVEKKALALGNVILEQWNNLCKITQSIKGSPKFQSNVIQEACLLALGVKE